jgi:hypothetical protein
LFSVTASPVGSRTGEATLEQIVQPQPPIRSRWLRLAVYAFSGVAFLADLTTDARRAFGVFSIPLISTAVYHRDKPAPWWLAAVASTLVVVGFFFPRISPDIVTAAANRALSIVAIFVTAFLVHHERLVCEQLTEQTVRAATADRGKAQLSNNLSPELRTPLSAITSASPICCFPTSGLTSKRRSGEFTPRGSSAALGRPE